MKFEKTYFYEFNAKFKESFDDLETAAKSEKPSELKNVDITNIRFLRSSIKQVKEKEKNG
ncbi:MAG: hypothetical protein RL736_268 [Pseudomonadota bacterium]|jgi:hypothetical protein